MSKSKNVDARIRVLHVSAAPVNRAASFSLLKECSDVDPDRFDVAVATGDPGLAAECSGRNIEVFEVPGLGSRNAMSDAKAVGNVIKGFDPHIVHSHMGDAGGSARMAAKNHRVQGVVHNLHDFAVREQGPLSKKEITSEKMLARMTSVFLTHTQRDKLAYISLGIGKADQFEIIRPGIPLEEFRQRSTKEARLQAREMFGMNDSTPLVGTVGRLEGQDDLQFIIKALAILEEGAHMPDTHVAIVGDGNLGPAVFSIAKEHNLQDRVLVIPGDVNLAEIMPGFDVFVPLSQGGNGVRTVAVKAMAAGVPVVTPPVDGILDYVTRDRSALVVDERNPLALAYALRDAVQASGTRSRLKGEGSLLAAEFDEANAANRLMELYQAVLQRR